VSDLREALRNVLNHASAENSSNTPDFILAELLTDVLAAFNKATLRRDAWFNKAANPQPSGELAALREEVAALREEVAALRREVASLPRGLLVPSFPACPTPVYPPLRPFIGDWPYHVTISSSSAVIPGVPPEGTVTK